eukprot:403343621
MIQQQSMHEDIKILNFEKDLNTPKQIQIIDEDMSLNKSISKKDKNSLALRKHQEKKKLQLKKVLQEKLGLDNLTDLELRSNFGSHFDLNYNEMNHNDAAKVIGDRRGGGIIAKMPDFLDVLGTRKNQINIDLSPSKINKGYLGQNLPNNEEQKQSLYNPDQSEQKSTRMTLSNFKSLFKLRGLLGVGAFGVVVLVLNKHSQQQSALKIINKMRLSSESIEILKNESIILQSLNHENIVKFKQIFETSQYLMIEMEYVKGGQLKKLYKRTPALSEREASQVVKNILEGVNYIHDRDYIHRDLKPENILLFSRKSLDIKIVDFGLSAMHKVLNFEQIDEKIGTLVYMAPEQASYQSYAKVSISIYHALQRIDIWAVGIIMYQLMNQGQHPLYNKGMSYYDYLMKLRTINDRSQQLTWSFPPNFSNLSIDFFKKLCSQSPSERYDARSALKHPWITGIFDAEIPLTNKQQIQQFDSEQGLRRIMRTVYFIAQQKSNSRNSQQSQSQFLEYKRALKQQSFGSELNSQVSTSAESYNTKNEEKIDDMFDDTTPSTIQRDEVNIQSNLRKKQILTDSNQIKKRQLSSIKKKRDIGLQQSLKQQLENQSQQYVQELDQFNQSLMKTTTNSFKSPQVIKQSKTAQHSQTKNNFRQVSSSKQNEQKYFQYSNAPQSFMMTPIIQKSQKKFPDIYKYSEKDYSDYQHQYKSGFLNGQLSEQVSITSNQSDLRQKSSLQETINNKRQSKLQQKIQCQEVIQEESEIPSQNVSAVINDLAYRDREGFRNQQNVNYQQIKSQNHNESAHSQMTNKSKSRKQSVIINQFSLELPYEELKTQQTQKNTKNVFMEYKDEEDYQDYQTLGKTTKSYDRDLVYNKRLNYNGQQSTATYGVKNLPFKPRMVYTNGQNTNIAALAKTVYQNINNFNSNTQNKNQFQSQVLVKKQQQEFGIKSSLDSRQKFQKQQKIQEILKTLPFPNNIHNTFQQEHNQLQKSGNIPFQMFGQTINIRKHEPTQSRHVESPFSIKGDKLNLRNGSRKNTESSNFTLKRPNGN